MKKNKKNNEIELANEAPKKGFLNKLFKNKIGQKQVLNYMKENKIKHFLFYTDVNNLLIILEQGIKIVSERKLKKGEEYTVWTYLENEKSIGLEFDKSTRANFWKWAVDAQINVSNVSVFGINPEKLAEKTKLDWAFDQKTNIVFIYENIPLIAIDWIMIKDKKNLQKAKTIIESNELDIKVFYGEKGNIIE